MLPLIMQLQATLHIIIFLAATPAFSQSFESWSAKAEKAAKAGELDQAVEDWTSALRIWNTGDGKSKKAKALASRGELYLKAGEMEGAIADFTAALKLDPKKAAWFEKRGEAQLKQERLAEAISDFYSATKLDINLGAAYLHRGEAYEKQGDLKFAKEDYKTACRLKVKDACALAKGEPPAAEKPKEPAKKKEPAKPSGPPPKVLKVEKIEAPKPKPKAPAAAAVDIPACGETLDKCTEETGDSYEQCAKTVPTCEAKPGKGCCPDVCLKLFLKGIGEDRSQSELYREIFSVKGTCAKAIR